MNNQQILLTIALGGKTLSLGKDTEIKLVDVEGLESPDYEISVQNNAQFDGGTVTGRRAAPRSILIRRMRLQRGHRATARRADPLFQSGFARAAHGGLLRGGPPHRLRAGELQGAPRQPV